MAENPFTTPPSSTPPSPALDLAAIARATPNVVSGAQWFWWIAGLSLVNSVILHAGGTTSFVIGLGFTQFADGFFHSTKPAAFVVDAIALGFFFGVGWFASKGHVWAFVTGIVLYVLDAVIYYFFEDWMPLAFHGLALFFMGRALLQLRAAIAAARATASAPPPLAS